MCSAEHNHYEGNLLNSEPTGEIVPVSGFPLKSIRFIPAISYARVPACLPAYIRATSITGIIVPTV